MLAVSLTRFELMNLPSLQKKAINHYLPLYHFTEAPGELIPAGTSQDRVVLTASVAVATVTVSSRGGIAVKSRGFVWNYFDIFQFSIGGFLASVIMFLKFSDER